MSSGAGDSGVSYPSKRRSNALPWLVGGCLALTACLICLVVLMAAGIIMFNRWDRYGDQTLVDSVERATVEPAPVLSPAPPTSPPATPTPRLPDAETGESALPGPVEPLITATPTATLAVPSAIQQDIPSEASYVHLAMLQQAEFPPRDYYESARRLGRTAVGERTVSARSLQIGDRQSFVTDEGQHEAILLAITEHAYFWFEADLDFDPDEVVSAAERFESEYYPVVVKLYGLDWQQGVDDDPRFSVLHLAGYADDSELGFFNSGDQYPRSINFDSNEQEVVYLNMENLKLAEPLYFGTLVHELQHLVQWHSDPNEPVWLSEGLAQFTELYAGLDTVDTPQDYLEEPGTPLNVWLHDAGDEIFAHYGAAYLFVVYLWEQFGDAAIQRLMRHPADGLAGVSAVIDELVPGLTLDQFVLDWATANYLDDSQYGTRYAYERLELDRPKHVLVVDRRSFESMQSLDQFGVAYVALELEGETTVTFAGDTTAALIQVPPHSGETMWYVPALNELDAQLTASFDLTGLTQASLSFWAWYDLEAGYDFAYISVSADDGATWDLLMPENAEAGEFGPALSGRSDDAEGNVKGWVEESISLAAYVGGPIMIRFEVLSDSAIAETGFAIDDVGIPELGHMNDAETGWGVWEARGFVRTGSLLPQLWRLNLIEHGPTPRVTPLILNERNQGNWTFDLDDAGGVLVITAQSPFVSDRASYWLAVDR